MRRPLLATGVYAGVLTAVIGGTTAFVRLDKTVTLVVDGQSRAVRTFAHDVGGLLEQQHVAVGAHDALTPGSAAPLDRDATVVLVRGRPLQVTVDGRPSTVWTTAGSLDQALDAVAPHLSGAYVSADRSTRIPLGGLAVDVRLPHALAVTHDGRTDRVVSTETTVRDALRRAGVAVAGPDRVSVPLGARPVDGMQVRVTRVRDTRVTSTTAIPFRTHYVADRTAFRGTRRLVRAGAPGARVATFHVYAVDGRVTSRHLERAAVSRQPRAAVVAVGTRARRVRRSFGGGSVGGGVDGLNWYALAACESSHNPRAANSSGHYGLYQFDLGTWHAVGGHGNPADASPAEQTYRAKLLYRQRGSSPWTCGSALHS